MEESVAPEQAQMTQGTEQVAQQQNAQPNTEWRNQFDQQYQQYLSRFNNIDDVVKTAMNAQSLLGKRTEEWKAEDAQTYKDVMSTVYDIPGSPEEYVIDVDEKTNIIDEQSIGIVKNVANHLGLTKDQCNELYGLVNELATMDNEEIEKSYAKTCEKSEEFYTKMWGDKAEQKINAIETCVDKVLPQITGMNASDIWDALDQGDAANNYIFMNCLSLLGSVMTEGGAIGYADMAPMDANLAAHQMRNDKQFMTDCLNMTDPRSADKRMQLYSMYKKTLG